MKTKLIGVFSVIILIAISISCKTKKKNETEAKEAEEVIMASKDASTYTIDTSSSIIKWIGSKPTGKHIGTLKLLNGTFTTKAEKLESGFFIIDMTSITVTDDDLSTNDKNKLQGHLKGLSEGKENHFFYITKFPKAIFEVTGVFTEKEKTMVAGNLTLKGITKNISFPIDLTKFGNIMTLTSESFIIDRTKWDVNYASKSIIENAGEKFINDEIELKINLKANKS